MLRFCFWLLKMVVTGWVALLAWVFGHKTSMRNWFIAQGPLFVKFAQLSSARNDVFPKSITKQFMTLTDQMIPMPSKHLIRVMAELKLHDIRMEDAPIGVGTVAQVHRGTRADGTDVAIKVWKPEVRRLFEDNYRNVKILAWPVRDVNDRLATCYQEIMMQCDSQQEYKNLTAFFLAYQSDPTVIIPEPILHLESINTMVMSFVHGVRLESVSTKDKPKCIQALNGFVLGHMTQHGMVHGDIHPGNLLWDGKSQRLAVLDFGLVQHLTPEYKELNLKWNITLFNGRWSHLALLGHLLLSKERIPGQGQLSVPYLFALRSTLRMCWTGKFETFQYVNRLNRVFKRHGWIYSPDIAWTELCLGTWECSLLALAGNDQINTIDCMRKIFIDNHLCDPTETTRYRVFLRSEHEEVESVFVDETDDSTIQSFFQTVVSLHKRGLSIEDILRDN